MSLSKMQLDDARADARRRLARPSRRGAPRSQLEASLFVQHRGRVSLAVLVNHLTVDPVRTDAGVPLVWGEASARALAADCMEHALASVGVRDASFAARLDALRQGLRGTELDAASEPVGAPVPTMLADALDLALRGAEHHEGWPAQVLWACRQAVGEASVARSWGSRVDDGRATDPTRLAATETELAATRRRAESGEHTWQCACLASHLAAPRADALSVA